MRAGLVLVVSCVVLALGSVSEVVEIFVSAAAECDDGCPPLGDDCGDCIHCSHHHAVAIALLDVEHAAVRVVDARPVIATSPAPPSAPSREILVVPRA